MSNLDAARRFMNAGRALETFGPTNFDVADMYRAALVQAVAALDHWVHEEIYHRAIVIVKMPGTKPRKFGSFQIPMDLFEKIHVEDQPTAPLFRDYLQQSLGCQSYQNPRKIQEGLALVSDVVLWQAVARKLTRCSAG
jgi:hypothetical protein